MVTVVTPNDVDALDRMRRSITGRGYAMTLRELADETGVTVSGAHRMVDRLVGAGKLTRTKSRVRGLDLPDQPDLRTVDSQALKAELARRGETLTALSRHEPLAYGRRAVSCAADCCQVQVRRGHLFCYQHWCAVPADLRTSILAAFGRKDVGAYQSLVAEARDYIETGQRWSKVS